MTHAFNDVIFSLLFDILSSRIQHQCTLFAYHCLANQNAILPNFFCYASYVGVLVLSENCVLYRKFNDSFTGSILVYYSSNVRFFRSMHAKIFPMCQNKSDFLWVQRIKWIRFLHKTDLFFLVLSYYYTFILFHGFFVRESYMLLLKIYVGWTYF